MQLGLQHIHLGLRPVHFVYFGDIPKLFCVLVNYFLELFHKFGITISLVALHKLFYFANETVCVPFGILIVDAHCISPPSLLQHEPSTIVSVELIPFACFGIEHFYFVGNLTIIAATLSRSSLSWEFLSLQRL